MSLGLVGSLLPLCGSASAATITPAYATVGAFVSDPAAGGFSASSSDLINSGQPTLVSLTQTAGIATISSSPAHLNNGPIVYGATSNGDGGTAFTPSNGSVVEVLLNTTFKPFGYNISSVVSLTGYVNGNQGRVNQDTPSSIRLWEAPCGFSFRETRDSLWIN